MGVFEQFPYSNFHDLNTDWILKVIKALDAKVDSMEEWKAEHTAAYNELKKFMDDLKNGILTPAMYSEMKRWIESNLLDIMGDMVKFVTFALNDAGYFVVNIPERWTELQFNTTELDIFTDLQPEYGHLTISY